MEVFYNGVQFKFNFRIKFYESVTFEFIFEPTIEVLFWKTGRNNNTCTRV